MTPEGEEFNQIKIATVNTFLDGVSADRPIKDWMKVSVKAFAGNSKLLHEQQLLNTEGHPVKTMITSYYPDVIVANEVVHSPWGSETMRQLQSNGYNFVASGRLGSTVLASRLPGEPIEIPVTNQNGASFCGLNFKDKNLIVIGLQTSAFFPKVRNQQITEVLQFCKDKINEGFQVVVAGDFNTEFKKDVGVSVPDDFVDLTKPSFPHVSLLKSLGELSRVPKVLIEKVFTISDGIQRSLDHILVPKTGKIISFDAVETTSDHLGLIADIKLQSPKIIE